MSKEGAGCRHALYGLLILSLLLLVLGLVLLIAFPIGIFPALLKSQLPIRGYDDGTLSQTGNLWKNLPVLSYYSFTMFNITNMDEVLYDGAKPRLVEAGPYVYLETEFKEGIEWRDGQNDVFYRNNKSFVYNVERSCAGCSEDDVITLPNAAYMAAVQVAQQNKQMIESNKLLGLLLDVLLILTGERPIRTVPVGGVLFASYPDPLIAVMNSELTATLKLIGNGTLFGLPLPDIPYMGYFPHYNHSSDENFLIRTGQSSVDEVMQIKQWAGYDRLPWWSGEAATKHVGAGDGTFYKPFLTRDDTLKNFQSYACRTFEMVYDGKESIDGVDTLRFRIPDDEMDTTTAKGAGYRYENTEKVDYFPSWPACPPSHRFHPWDMGDECADVDCSLGDNFCSDCCDGSHAKDTVYLPPGIVPLRCLPGQNKLLPFAGFLSAPHLALSPQLATDTIVGLNPDSDKYATGWWYVNPTTGSTVKAVFQTQLVVPIYNTDKFTDLNSLRNSFLPAVWFRIDGGMKDYAHDFVELTSKTIPSIALGVGIGLVVLAVLLAGLAYYCIRRRAANSNKVADYLPSSSSGGLSGDSPINSDSQHSPAVLKAHSPIVERGAAIHTPVQPAESRENLHWQSDTLRAETRQNRPPALSGRSTPASVPAPNLAAPAPKPAPPEDDNTWT